MNFTDPFGLRSLTQAEIALHKTAGGSTVDYSKIDLINEMPTVGDVRAAAEKVGVDTSSFSDEDIQNNIDISAAMSLPGGGVYVPDNARDNQEKLNALIAHETEHQSQYQNLGAKDAFEQLMKETELGNKKYITEGTLEYSAQQVENRANKIQQQGNYQEGVKNK